MFLAKHSILCCAAVLGAFFGFALSASFERMAPVFTIGGMFIGALIADMLTRQLETEDEEETE